MPGAKNWVFTLNNYLEEDKSKLNLLGDDKELISYLIYGEEVGEEGTPHLQGYVSFIKRLSMKKVKTLLGPRYHLEVMKGNPKQAADYCKKDNKYVEFGSLPKGQGTRNDLQVVHEEFRSGKRIRDIVDENFGTFVRYTRGLQYVYNFYAPRRNWVTNVVVIYGSTGTGKTKSIYDLVEFDMWRHWDKKGKWFCGYDRHEQVLFDEFSGGVFQLTFLLELLDAYPMMVETKGGKTAWLPREIYITSNLAPSEWYPNADNEHQLALMRRLTTIHKL